MKLSKMPTLFLSLIITLPLSLWSMTYEEWRVYKETDAYKIKQQNIQEREKRARSFYDFTAKQSGQKNLKPNPIKTKKPFTYSHMKNKPPLVSKRYRFHVNGVSASIPYDSNIPIDRSNSKITRLIMAIHSSNHNAKMYLDNTATLAQHTGNTNNTLIVAPQLLMTSLLEPTLQPNFLYWEVPPFRGSSKALYNGEKVSVSAYEIVDRMIDEITKSSKFVNLRDIIIFGHSAGGQMVNRYAAYSRFSKKGLSARYIVMAPSSYVYFDKQRAINGEINKFAIPKAASKKYNRWGNGMEKLYAVHKRNHVTAKMMREQYAKSKILYLVGAKDNDPNDNSLGKNFSSNLQGSHRLERAKIYYNYLKYYFGNSIVKRHGLHIIPGVGHSSRGLMASKEGRNYLFMQ